MCRLMLQKYDEKLARNTPGLETFRRVENPRLEQYRQCRMGWKNLGRSMGDVHSTMGLCCYLLFGSEAEPKALQMSRGIGKFRGYR